MRTQERGVFGGFTAFPWALTLTLGWGWVEVPPGQSRGYSLGNSKKEKKINTCFAQVSNSDLLHWNPNVYKRERVPDLSGVGRP